MKDFLRKIVTRSKQISWRSSERLGTGAEIAGQLSEDQKISNTGYLESLVRATELEELGRLDEALSVLETAAPEAKANSHFLTKLASLQRKNGLVSQARDTYRSILLNDITNLDAIEAFLELNYAEPGPAGTVTEVITELSNAIPRNESLDAEAAVFVLPSMKLVSAADEAIRRLKYSHSAVARFISSLATSDAQATEELVTADSDFREAQSVMCFVRGDYAAASELKMDALGGASLRALKQAIQRELRAARTGEASELLAQYTRFDPNSEWSQRAHNQITRNRQVRSRHQLTLEGFPFPDLQLERDYKPTRNKVLYLLHNSLPYDSAGYSTRTHGLMSALRSRGWRVQGVTRLGYPSGSAHYQEGEELPASFNVIDGNMYRRLFDTEHEGRSGEPLEEYVRRYSEALYKLALKEKPALIHAASNHWNGLAAVIVARRLGIPSIYEVRGLWEITEASRNPAWGKSGAFRFMARMETDAAHAATRVLTITQALKEELVQRGIPASKITVVPNAVDPSRFKPSIPDRSLSEALGLEGKTVIGYVGSLTDYEGLTLLVQAVSHLAQNRNDFKLVFVGSGPEEQSLRDLVTSLGLTEFVIFAGRVPHHLVSSYYELIEIVALPRLSLPVCEMVSPLKPFEAMASEKAIVASNVAALAEIVNHGETGLLHEKDSVASLTENLRLLLDRPDLRRELGRNAKEWVKKERSWSRVSGSVARVYESLLEHSRSDSEILTELAAVDLSQDLSAPILVEALYEIGKRNISTYIGQRLLVHSALNAKSSRYSLRIVKLFVEYGLWHLVSYLARHALPSVRDKSFARILRSLLAKKHDLRTIASARVSVTELSDVSSLVETLEELLTGTKSQSGHSVLSPLFLVAKFRTEDASLIETALRVCGFLGIQLIIERDGKQQDASKQTSENTQTQTLQMVAQDDERFLFCGPSQSISSIYGSLGALTRKEVIEIAAIHWLLAVQTSTVLRLQRAVWRHHLVESVASIIPLTTIPDAFSWGVAALETDVQTERYLQRAASALLNKGYYRAAREVLLQISLDNRDSRYSHRLAEAAFGEADFTTVLELKEQLENTPRMEKILSESEAAVRMIERLERAAHPNTKRQPSLGSGDKGLRVVSILHASAPDQTGGYANRAHALLSSLGDYEIEVHAYTRPGFPEYALGAGEMEEILYEGVRYHRLGSRLPRESGEFAYMEESVAAYRTVLEAEKPDVVHLRSTYVSALPGLIAAKELSIPALYEVSGMWELVYASYGDARREGLRARTVRMENQVLSNADRIVTMTEAMASEIYDRVVPKNPITLVPNAVDLNRFKPQPKRTDLKASLGWQTDVPVIGYAGSIVDYEGLDVLLHAAKLLQNKGLVFRVLVIGDGAVRQDLEKLADQLGLTEIVEFTGRLPHRLVGEYYTIFDVCAFPRYLTPATRAVSPLKPFEALAAAKPVVVSDIPALSEIVGKHSALPRGLAVEENNPIALSQALERLLVDEDLRVGLSENGLNWVRCERSWDGVSRLFAEAIAETAKMAS